MSFLELSLNYVYAKPMEDFAALSFGGRRSIVKSGILALVAFAAVYLYFSGTIVSDNIKQINLARQYELEARVLDNMRSSLILGSSGITMESLKASGFYETTDLNIIKRSYNVASSKNNLFQ